MISVHTKTPFHDNATMLKSHGLLIYYYITFGQFNINLIISAKTLSPTMVITISQSAGVNVWKEKSYQMCAATWGPIMSACLCVSSTTAVPPEMRHLIWITSMWLVKSGAQLHPTEPERAPRGPGIPCSAKRAHAHTHWHTHRSVLWVEAGAYTEAMYKSISGRKKVLHEALEMLMCDDEIHFDLFVYNSTYALVK